jgi:hypothetical protein
MPQVAARHELTTTQERRCQLHLDNVASGFWRYTASGQVQTTCRFEYEGSYVIWRENALYNKLSYQCLWDESIDSANFSIILLS